MKNKNIQWSVREKKFDPCQHNKILNVETKILESKKESVIWQSWLLDWNSVNEQHHLSAQAQKKIPASNISLSLKLDSWNPFCYLLIPGAVYNGNRFQSRKISYSPKLEQKEDISPDCPVIISDVPRLNITDGYSSLYDRSGSFSIPVIIIFNPEDNSCAWINFNFENEFGDTGINIVENESRNSLTISFESPVVRPLTKYRITDNAFPSDDIPANFNIHDEVSFSVKTEIFPCRNIEALLSHYFAEFWKSPKIQQEGHLPFSHAFKKIENKYNQQNWVEDPGYYSVGLRNGKYRFLQDWQIGWTGGMINSLPLLGCGTEKSQAQVLRMFDWLFPDGVAPSGFFWDSGEEGDKWYGGDIRREHTKNWHLIRKSGDGLYYILKHFRILERRNYEIKEHWHEGLKKVANAFVRVWQKCGQFGQFVHSLTGEIMVGNSTSGAIVPGALVLAWKQYGNQDYLSTARESAEWFYQNFVAKGFTCGGPGDALQNPDSESAYAMVESLTLLYEETREQQWLERARIATGLFSTWVMGYNYHFPRNSLFGKLNLTTFGTVFANTQNKHAAPGICTYSGAALITLYRYSGDVTYLNLLQAITKALTQYLSYEGHQINGLQSGWVSERINTNDWLEGIGETMAGSTWAEVSLMLTWMEIPSVFIDVKRKISICFDKCAATIDWKTSRLILQNKYKVRTEFSIMLSNEGFLEQLKVDVDAEIEIQI